MKKVIYQRDFSKGSPVLYQKEQRVPKAQKILRVISEFFGGEISTLSCLDIGSSTGIIGDYLASHFKLVIGIDIDEQAVTFAQKNRESPNYQPSLGDAICLPFKNESFDLAICNHIYEHVPDSSCLLDEIYRVLKKNGTCYFGAPNRFSFIEGHYHLPLLSWIPKRVAHLYLRALGRGDFYYENHLALGGLRSLVRRFKIHDFTLKIIADPAKYGFEKDINIRSWAFRLSQKIARYVYFFIPTYIWVLEKGRCDGEISRQTPS